MSSAEVNELFTALKGGTDPEKSAAVLKLVSLAKKGEESRLDIMMNNNALLVLSKLAANTGQPSLREHAMVVLANLAVDSEDIHLSILGHNSTMKVVSSGMFAKNELEFRRASMLCLRHLSEGTNDVKKKLLTRELIDCVGSVLLDEDPQCCQHASQIIFNLATYSEQACELMGTTLGIITGLLTCMSSGGVGVRKDASKAMAALCFSSPDASRFVGQMDRVFKVLVDVIKVNDEAQEMALTTLTNLTGNYRSCLEKLFAVKDCISILVTCVESPSLNVKRPSAAALANMALGPQHIAAEVAQHPKVFRALLCAIETPDDTTQNAVLASIAAFAATECATQLSEDKVEDLWKILMMGMTSAFQERRKAAYGSACDWRKKMSLSCYPKGLPKCVADAVCQAVARPSSATELLQPLIKPCNDLFDVLPNPSQQNLKQLIQKVYPEVTGDRQIPVVAGLLVASKLATLAALAASASASAIPFALKVEGREYREAKKESANGGASSSGKPSLSSSSSSSAAAASSSSSSNSRPHQHQSSSSSLVDPPTTLPEASKALVHSDVRSWLLAAAFLLSDSEFQRSIAAQIQNFHIIKLLTQELESGHGAIAAKALNHLVIAVISPEPSYVDILEGLFEGLMIPSTQLRAAINPEIVTYLQTEQVQEAIKNTTLLHKMEDMLTSEDHELVITTVTILRNLFYQISHNNQHLKNLFYSLIAMLTVALMHTKRDTTRNNIMQIFCSVDCDMNGTARNNGIITTIISTLPRVEQRQCIFTAATAVFHLSARLPPAEATMYTARLMKYILMLLPDTNFQQDALGWVLQFNWNSDIFEYTTVDPAEAIDAITNLPAHLRENTNDVLTFLRDAAAKIAQEANGVVSGQKRRERDRDEDDKNIKTDSRDFGSPSRQSTSSAGASTSNESRKAVKREGNPQYEDQLPHQVKPERQ